MFVHFYWRITRYYFILARQKQYINRYILKKDFHSVSKEPFGQKKEIFTSYDCIESVLLYLFVGTY